MLPSWRDDPRANDPNWHFDVNTGWSPSWRADPKASDPNWSFSVDKGWQQVLPSWRDDPRAQDPTQTFSMEKGWETIPLGTLIGRQNEANEALLAKQKEEERGLFGRYQTAISGQEALPALYKRLEGELGIPGLTGTVQGYKDQINQVQQLLGNLTPDIGQRTKGTFTTEAQQRRQIAAEGDPLRMQLANLGYGMAPAAGLLSTAQGNLGTLLGLSAQEQAKQLKPLETELGAYGDRFAREITGFTTERQNTLTALLDKLDRERTLSDRDWAAAQELAAEEREFTRQKELLDIEFKQTKELDILSAARKKAEDIGLRYPSAPSAPSGGGKTSIDWEGLLSPSSGIPQTVRIPELQGGSFGGRGYQFGGGGTLSL